MPEWLAITLAILGGGLLTGAGAFLRARGQNRIEAAKQQTDDRTLLFKDTREWLAYQDAQIASLIARNGTLEARLLTQGEKQAAHSAEIEALQRQDREKTAQITRLQEQNTQQAAQIATLTEENASTTQRLKVEIAKGEFLERECNDLRRENERLRTLLPPRFEVTE